MLISFRWQLWSSWALPGTATSCQLLAEPGSAPWGLWTVWGHKDPSMQLARDQPRGHLPWGRGVTLEGQEDHRNEGSLRAGGWLDACSHWGALRNPPFGTAGCSSGTAAWQGSAPWPRLPPSRSRPCSHNERKQDFSGSVATTHSRADIEPRLFH